MDKTKLEKRAIQTLSKSLPKNMRRKPRNRLENRCGKIVGILELSDGNEAIVDKEDFDLVKNFRWSPKSRKNYTVYAKKYYSKNSHQYLHRMLLNPPKGMICDHINGDGLDNRRSNIRVVNFSQNIFNRKKNIKSSSRFKGVYRRRKQILGYETGIWHNGKYNLIGYFKNEEDAARAYDKKAYEIRGEFARLNFPKEIHGIR